ncbi:MAG: DUF2914 domain-containing protein [Sandaracinus sp.]|nr:DUF2914 domain-containing protein [Myxococcales bacterium]MCB9613992.1 DUF2914 domain-containing protein [Sandaracinus sp.]MCB9624512.1 DUF2914 domain-containing protein [Sandaracinus sp.]MCB9635481.1 DUF2914 domain-containing protein [Sandaracinus sp.]
MIRRTFVAVALVSLALPLAAQEESASALEVTELVLSKGVEGGTPVDPTDRFSRSDGRVYATIRLNNPSRAETTIRVAFVREGASGSRGVELSVPAQPRYRTMARTGTRGAGRYRVVVYDAEDREIATANYEVVE